jgi:hypothetical protein
MNLDLGDTVDDVLDLFPFYFSNFIENYFTKDFENYS